MIDVRNGGIKGRNTQFQITQSRLMDCALDGFVPGTDGDPEPQSPCLRVGRTLSRPDKIAKIRYKSFYFTIRLDKAP